MDLSAFLTSAGVNTGVCLGLFSLYSVLRKQPNLVCIYFGQKIARSRSGNHDPFWFGRLVPSAGWMMKAWSASEDELYAIGGVDAVVFLRTILFSIRVFSVAAVVCMFLLLPVNYYGKDMVHKGISTEPLNVFTIVNVIEGSKWLPIHCLALYIVSCCACVLLYFEYKKIMELRLAHIADSLSHPSHFTIIARAIPWFPNQSYSETLYKFFSDFYPSSYLAHQMVYQSGAVQKMTNDAEKAHKKLKSNRLGTRCITQLQKCCFCGGTRTAFKIISADSKSSPGETSLKGKDVKKQECGVAFVFFRTRYAALVASKVLQTPNPMIWAINPAPDPEDVFWSNLSVPYRLFWIRKISVVVASACSVIFFLFPVVFTQSLVHLDKIKKIFPFFKNMFKGVTMDYGSLILFSFSWKIFEQLLTGYLPSVVLMIFLSLVPPMMMFFSTVEGAISRSGRKRKTCIKVVYFVIWNVFFANILTDAAIGHYQVSIRKLGDPKNIPTLLARAVPASATFFMTYVLTSGWASLSLELIQPFPLLSNLFCKYVLHVKDDSYGTYAFPYHTEFPRVLLFGLLGFTCSILAPLILPILVVFFVMAYLVYTNQIVNVYVTEYDSGGQYWPIVHNTTIFSLVLSQTIALGVFGIKKSPIASALIFPLGICTILFHEYCRQRFQPIFSRTPAQTIIEMDRRDENSGKFEEMHGKFQTAYCQFRSKSLNLHTIEEENRTDNHTQSIDLR